MTSKIIFIVISCSVVAIGAPVKCVAISTARQAESTIDDTLKLENPISVAYLKKRLRKSSPRLVLTPALEKKLKAKIKNDAVVKNYYEAIKLNALQIQQTPLLTRRVEGRRLLAVSREMLYRMNVLATVHVVEKDPTVLKRINTSNIL